MRSNKVQVIHSDNLTELHRLKAEFEFIGRETTLDANKMSLTVHNLPVRKAKKRRPSKYETLNKKYS